MTNRERKTNRWALLAIGVFAVVALLLVSWDSYLYDLWQHHDVIWFYLCGKAWMNSMTPYVDFADSKGPLLWLIYGIGYLISPHDYTGMYWLSCVLYTFIFYQCYKCARLFVRDTRLALVAVLLSAVFFLSGLTHIEVRAEDYCYAFMLPIFYRFLRFNVEHEHSRRYVKSTAMLLGFALGATLLIKYSCTLMLGIFIPYFCFVIPRRCGYSPWRALGWCAATGIVTILPMIGWLAWHGCLDDFINEYFLNTFNTFDNLHGEEITVKQVLLMFLGKRVILFTLGVIASVIIYCKTIGKGWMMALIALLWFMAVILLNGTDRIYLNVLSLFTVLAAGIVTQALSRWLRWWAAVGVLSVGVLALLFGTVEHKSLFAKQLLDREIWYYYPTLLSQYEQPRLLYLMCHDHGEGVPVDAMPACKYWSLQMGYTQAMIDDQTDAVKQHKCDAVFVESDNTEMIKLVEENGYYLNDFVQAGMGDKSWKRFLMYSSKPLKPMASRYPSPMEVLTKRNVVLEGKK